MKTLEQKVFDLLNELNPDYLEELIDIIEKGDEDKSVSIDQYLEKNPQIDPHEQD